MRPIFQLRNEHGEFHRLVREMQLGDHEYFFKYFRMYPDTFELLLKKIAPFVERLNFMREPISAEERLEATLRYFVTGDEEQFHLVIDWNFRP